MKIIGHRGAAGLALENTMASIRAALKYGVDGIEIDVRLTRDNHLVVCHDAALSRISADDEHVKKLTLAQMRDIRLINGDRVPTLEEVLQAVGKTLVIVELKSPGCADALHALLHRFPEANVAVASFRHDEAERMKQLRPNIPVYLAEQTKPLEVIQHAVAIKADGLDLNFWLLNPLTYWLARRAKLDIFVYTVNNKFLFWFLSLLYPSVGICTDFPDRFAKFRKPARSAAP